MSYRIEQDSEYIGRDRWRWSVWIETTSEPLDKLAKVVWLLHPSFKQSRVVRSDAAAKFKLEESGWGTFLIRAELETVTGEQRELTHDLRLDYPDGADTPRVRGLRSASQPNAPKVFLSYSAADKQMADELKQQLESIGTKVLDASQIQPGESWMGSLGGMIRQADAVIGVVGEDEASPFVVREIQHAQEFGKRVLAVINDRNSNPGLLSASQVRMHFEPGKAEPIGRLVQDWLSGAKR